MDNQNGVMGNADLLSRRMIALGTMNEVRDSGEYADEWEKLAADLDAVGRPCSAAMCRDRAKYWRSYPGGHYTRIIAGPFCDVVSGGLHGA